MKHIVKLSKKIKLLISENDKMYYANCFNLNGETLISSIKRTDVEVLPNSLLSLCMAEIPIKAEAPTLKEILEFVENNKLKGIESFYVVSFKYNTYLNQNVAEVAFFGYQKGFTHPLELSKKASKQYEQTF